MEYKVAGKFTLLFVSTRLPRASGRRSPGVGETFRVARRRRKGCEQEGGTVCTGPRCRCISDNEINVGGLSVLWNGLVLIDAVQGRPRAD